MIATQNTLSRRHQQQPAVNEVVLHKEHGTQQPTLLLPEQNRGSCNALVLTLYFAFNICVNVFYLVIILQIVACQTFILKCTQSRKQHTKLFKLGNYCTNGL